MIKSCQQWQDFFYLSVSNGRILLPMIKLEDLWVGDDVKVLSTGETGKFLSISDGQALIKLSHGETILLRPQDLEIYTPATTESDPFPHLTQASSDIHKPHLLDFPTSIDLHIETLNPDLITALPERIIMYQLDALQDYLDKAEDAGLKFFTIIHGKGRGVLKAETLHILKGRETVKFTVEAHNGGAVEVWMK